MGYIHTPTAVSDDAKTLESKGTTVGVCVKFTEAPTPAAKSDNTIESEGCPPTLSLAPPPTEEHFIPLSSVSVPTSNAPTAIALSTTIQLGDSDTGSAAVEVPKPKKSRPNPQKQKRARCKE
jgi:hypothetical protein